MPIDVCLSSNDDVIQPHAESVCMGLFAMQIIQSDKVMKASFKDVLADTCLPFDRKAHVPQPDCC